MSMCSPTEAKPSIEMMSVTGMSMNVELQAKMIEELLVKNSQLVDENTASQQMRGPFGGNDSLNEGHSGNFGMPVSG